MNQMQVVQGDITGLEVDAIVTAANESLLGGGGVDGAVHRAAGPQLLGECIQIGLCPEGEARITKGYLLPARWIIHAVGPVYEDGTWGEAETLAATYRAALEVAASNGVETLAFPCLATGEYGFPKAQACDIAVATVGDWLENNALPRQITFCCFDDEDAQLYAERLGTAAV